MIRLLSTLVLVVGTCCATTLPALAHTSAGHTHMLADGFAHPFGGADHVLAMVTLGLWASLGTDSRRWLWPLAFVLSMTGGALLGLAGMALPFVEPGILASIVVLGALTALAVPAPIWLGAAVAAVFAIFHGHAHGVEALTGGAGMYVTGFMLSTAILHAIGVTSGLALQRLSRRLSVQAAGLASAVGGLFLMFR